MIWVKRIALAVLGLVLGAAIGLYGWSEWILRRDVGVPLTPIVADRSPAGIAEGARLAKIHGCLSCHEGGHGGVFIDAPIVARLGAPAYAAFVPEESDAALARSIRQGVSGDGRALFIMPSHATLADDETAEIIGFLRTLRPSPEDVAVGRSFGPVGRFLIVSGKLPESRHPALRGGPHPWPDRGAYLAQACLGCHNLYTPSDRSNETAPPLAIMAASYDDAQFLTLLRTGKGLSKPDLGLMSRVARRGLSSLNDDEIAAIHAYLKRMAEKAPAS